MKGAKNPYTSRNGHMFSFLDADGTMALRLSPEMTDEFRSTHESGDVIQYGSTMRGYSSVPPELLASTDSLAEWFDRSWEWIGTLPSEADEEVGAVSRTAFCGSVRREEAATCFVCEVFDSVRQRRP